MTAIGLGGLFTNWNTMLFSAKHDGAPIMAIWALIVLATIASMAIAESMARTRGRPTKVWVWIAAIVGPLSPLALYALGNRSTPDP
jgi:hypothetical protein